MRTTKTESVDRGFEPRPPHRKPLKLTDIGDTLGLLSLGVLHERTSPATRRPSSPGDHPPRRGACPHPGSAAYLSNSTDRHTCIGVPPTTVLASLRSIGQRAAEARYQTCSPRPHRIDTSSTVTTAARSRTRAREELDGVLLFAGYRQLASFAHEVAGDRTNLCQRGGGA